MSKDLTANAAITIDAPASKVWDALVKPKIIRKYMFGTDVVSDWKVGSPIVWKGEWKGKAYEDKGKILRLEPRHVIQYSHYSPLSGAPDTPDNYHTVTIELSGKGDKTSVTLSQDKNGNEQEKQESEKNWGMMLAGLKKVSES